MAVTAQQIAELAGVSRGTVDRALHNRGRVNPEVAAKIHKIAAELGYKPNLIGQALVKSRREGKTVFYSLADDHVKTIINQGLDHVKE